MSAQHTPGPLYAAHGSMGQGLIISETDGRNVAVVYDEKDAEPIVRAVNCHNDLLAALEWQISSLQEGLHERAEALKFARAAISKAKGE